MTIRRTFIHIAPWVTLGKPDFSVAAEMIWNLSILGFGCLVDGSGKP